MSTETPHADDLPDLPAVPDMPDMPDVPDMPAASLEAIDGPAPAAGERPSLRELDKAPEHLRLAALIVVGGSLLPWMPGKIVAPVENAWLMTLAAKALMLGAAWLWLQQVMHDWGPPLKGVLAQLASLNLKPKAKEAPGKARRKTKNAPTHLEHPFPTGLHILSAVLAITALVVASREPRLGLGDTSNGIPEVAMLGWAAFTWVHIASYERWGGFNPLFPLMFLGMLLSGVAAVIGAASSETMTGLPKLMGMLGGASVAAGGGLAAYTIAEAMMQAKKEGDRKKAEALEARRLARKKKD